MNGWMDGRMDDLALALGLEGISRLRVVMPVSLPLVDKPVVNLLELQPCLLN